MEYQNPVCERLRRWLLPVGFVILIAPTFSAAAERPVQFNRDVRAILSDKCFACHGPDAETVEGGLRLDLRDAAIDAEAIVPGDAEASELVHRIFADDDDTVMPPHDLHKPLTDSERKLLRRWITEGAEYEPHWAYVPLQRPVVPSATSEDATTSPIDRFIARQLDEQKIQPVPAADRITLIRRLAWDLNGLPPTVAEVDAFVSDTSTDAVETLVDRLLDSQRYGERMASYWLDLVRYADTVGYHGDQNVSQSPYRDYVIQAFNDNMPYDQFVQEQLAGDLLPDATLDQRVASGYNRLNQTTEEGGSQAKEYLAIYFADRVRNVSQVFMGATVGCAQCHDHKYDPYTARDFYALGAFFADLNERGVYGARSRPPVIPVPSEEQQREMDALDQSLDQLKGSMPALRELALKQQPQWETATLAKIEQVRQVETLWIDDDQPPAASVSGSWDFVAAPAPVHRGEKSRRQQADGLVQHYIDNVTTTVAIVPEQRFFAWVYLDPQTPPQSIMLQFNDGDWNHRAVWGNDSITYGRRKDNWAGYHRVGPLPKVGGWTRLEVDPADLGLSAKTPVDGIAFTQFGGLVYWDDTGWTTSDGVPAAVAEALVIAEPERSKSQREAIREYYLSTAEPIVELQTQINRIAADRKRIEDEAPTTVVSQAVTPREIRILPRGNWMDDSGPVVQPAIPTFLGQLETDGRRPTRLDLAAWLGRNDNPLTARTMANRIWSLLFGRGISSSVDDLGGQGSFPTHPDLLDWLAVEFVESGWDIKHLIRTIVTSQAYQRGSQPTPELRRSDPSNLLLARQGRFRIDAEMVRDNALAVSGLLVEQLGGASVHPYQPAGYYAQLNFPRRTYQADSGSDQYRRGLYTHWQRTFLHPMLKAFDAPSREECTAARGRSNTPLQSLTLLNDPTFVEAAVAFAARIADQSELSTNDRIVWAYRTAVSRPPQTQIVAVLQDLFDQHLDHYRKHPDAAAELVSAGIGKADGSIDVAELAAWTSVARTILNLHETIMRY